MRRMLVLLVVCLMPVPGQAVGPGYGADGGVMSAGGDPCDRGTIFNALKVVRAYRDNRAFAYHHFEGKQLQISGRLLLVARDTVPATKLEDGVEVPITQDVFVAIVTPDGKAPKGIGLEFRFPVDQLKDNPQARCDLAALWAGQFVTIRGTCIGAKSAEGADYVAVIFENSELVR